MTFGGGSSSGSTTPQQNPQASAAMYQGINNAGAQVQLGNSYLGDASNLLSQPYQSQLPLGMISDVNTGNAISQANSAENELPAFMQLSTNNPLLAQANTPQQIAQTYGNILNQYSEAPQEGSAAESQWLGGNLGDAGSSSFGANFLSNMEASGNIQSFLGGQSYYDDLLNNSMNERNDYFQTQVDPALQADEFNQSQNQQSLQNINNYNLGRAGGFATLGQNANQGGSVYNQGAGIAGGYGESFMNNSTQLQKQQMQQNFQGQQGQGQALGQLAGGLGGLFGGGANTLFGGGNSTSGSNGGFMPLLNDPSFGSSGAMSAMNF